MEMMPIIEKGESMQTVPVETGGSLDDEESFTRWVAATQKSLIRFCRQFVGNWHDAEDIAQEAYIRAWRKRGGFRGESSKLTWLMAIARRASLDFLRRNNKPDALPLDEHDSATENNINTILDVQMALKRLTADDRMILYLRIGEDMPFNDIAKVLGRTVSTCRKRFERAKGKFSTEYYGEEKR